MPVGLAKTPLGRVAAALLSASVMVVSTAVAPCVAAQPPTVPAQSAAPPESLAQALSPQAWTQVEQSIERALAWLAKQQRADGSIAAPANAQPAATSFAVMAYLSKGHLPGEGPYGAQIDKAIDFVVRCQQPDGLLAFADAGSRSAGKTATYNHGIAGLMLTEAYGMTDRVRAEKLKPVIQKALNYTRQLQVRPKNYDEDNGGWRYLDSYSYGAAESDLSVTGWQLMFLRSAKNAEFDVPKQYVDDAIAYVYRCWDERQGVFYYRKVGGETRWSRGMVGVGILSLAMAGQHDTRVAQRAGDWLLAYPFRGFGERVGSGDRFFYSVYYCTQAMAQLGGHYWKQFFPGVASVLLRSQQASGEWPSEPNSGDRVYGNTYTTAMAVLSLTPPLQLLPVYQR